MRVKYLIVGAAPTGLGAAYRLKELGVEEVLVVESEDVVGGLARSVVDAAGFTWDIGGHVHFSRYEYYNRVLDRVFSSEDWLWHEREAWIWVQGRFVPYPFQNNLRYLHREDQWRCIQGLLDASRSWVGSPANLREWIQGTFGAGIAELFMLPYNIKVWACDPATMSFEWVAERVAPVDVGQVLRNILLEHDERSWGPNNRFRFPRAGGTGALWKAVARAVGLDKIRCGRELVWIDPHGHSAGLNDGTTVGYQNLVSTMPLDVLCSMVPGLPDEVRGLASSLRYSTSHVVGLGLRGQPRDELRTKMWMYFPEANCPFYRATVFSSYSPHHTPDSTKYWSLMAEISESAEKPVQRERIVDDTIDGALSTGLIDSRNDVVSRWLYSARYGYPVPSVERNVLLKTIVPCLEEKRIFSRGRFGGWCYEVSNQDHSFMQGVELVDRLENGTQESTYVLRRAASARPPTVASDEGSP